MRSSYQNPAISERFDWALLGIVMAIALLGVYNLYSSASASASGVWHQMQLLWLGLGVGVIVVLGLLDYRIVQRFAYAFYVGVVLLLIGVIAFGVELNGAKRWISFGFFLMQPSELLKIAVIIVTAKYFHDRGQKTSYTLTQLIVPFAIIGSGVIFVLKQPDLGTSLVILAIFMTMVLFEGVRWKNLMTLCLMLALSAPFVWSFGMKDYQKARVLSFIDLDADQHGQSWQVRQSMIAFGSGRVWGKGHVEGTQIQKGFVPEHENDFVAANWAEEHGFVGMMLVLSLYMALMLAIMRISKRSTDRFGALVCVGVAAMFFWHTFVNLGMVTGLLPVVGLTLPLMSYGGSSLLSMLAAVGLLNSISMRRKIA